MTRYALQSHEFHLAGACEWICLLVVLYPLLLTGIRLARACMLAYRQASHSLTYFQRMHTAACIHVNTHTHSSHTLAFQCTRTRCQLRDRFLVRPLAPNARSRVARGWSRYVPRRAWTGRQRFKRAHAALHADCRHRPARRTLIGREQCPRVCRLRLRGPSRLEHNVASKLCNRNRVVPICSGRRRSLKGRPVDEGASAGDVSSLWFGP